MLRIAHKRTPFTIASFERSLRRFTRPKRIPLRVVIGQSSAHFIFTVEMNCFDLNFSGEVVWYYEQVCSRVTPRDFDSFVSYILVNSCVTKEQKPERLGKHLSFIDKRGKDA